MNALPIDWLTEWPSACVTEWLIDCVTDWRMDGESILLYISSVNLNWKLTN